MKDAIPDRIAFHYYKETAIAATFRNNVAMTLYRARARLELVKNRHFVRRQRDEFRESIDECIGNRRRRRRTSHFPPPVRVWLLYLARTLRGRLRQVKLIGPDNPQIGQK